jgi:PAS domain S-box-containing protein
MKARRISSGRSHAEFANDEMGRIVRWNRAAEKLLGYRGKEVLGRPCHDLLCGRDIFGNRFCLPTCSLISMVRRDQEIHDFIMEIRTARGRTLRAKLSVRSRLDSKRSRTIMVHTVKPAD